MSGNVQRHPWRLFPSRATRLVQRRPRAMTTGVESLEERRLLSTISGFGHTRRVVSPAGVLAIQVNGPGVVGTKHVARGVIDLKVLGTTQDSTLTVTQLRSRFHLSGRLLNVRNLVIGSQQIGSVKAGLIALNGTMTPLTSSVDTLEFGALGPAAQIDVNGSVNTMNIGQVVLGPTGHVIVAGNLSGGSDVTNNSSTSNTGNSSTTTQTAGAISIGSMLLDGGEFVVVGNSIAPIQVANNMILSHNGLFSIGRDQAGSFAVGGSLVLDTGGQFVVGRDVSSLNVGGDLIVNPTASGIAVGGNLNGLTVSGIFRGQNSPTDVDLGVGLNLTGLSILGGTYNQGGLQNANINVGKNLSQINIAHGIFRSWITAGVAIDGGAAGSDTPTVGADGVVAIYNSEIDAGTSLTNFRVGGDIKSGFPTGDTTGYPTRIIAGKVRSTQVNTGPNLGTFLANGRIRGLVVNGDLADAVLAASVAPFGGDGSLPPPSSYSVPARGTGTPPGIFTNYQAPAGLTDLTKPNYSIRNVVAGAPSGDAAWAQPPDQRHDTVLENGTIDVTISGSVVSSQASRLDDSYDFAGIFAVNTVGVTTP